MTYTLAPVSLKSPITRITVLFHIVAIILLSGCVQSNPGFTVKPEAFDTIPAVYADESTTEVTLALNSTLLVTFPWTPEDGRYWRVSVTEGLFVTGDRYVPYPADVPVEVTGKREWMVKAISPGVQSFVGTLRPRAHSWNQDSLQYQITVNIPGELQEDT